jgi:hypothetical protein
MLDNVQVAKPCSADWGKMPGDARVRHCCECQLGVYNLSEMTRPEAEAFLRKATGRVCIRIYRRADGTVITRDCPKGLAAVRRALALRLSVIVATAFWIVGGIARPLVSKSAIDRLVADTTEAIKSHEPFKSFSGGLHAHPRPVAQKSVASSIEVPKDIAQGGIANPCQGAPPGYPAGVSFVRQKKATPAKAHKTHSNPSEREQS